VNDFVRHGGDRASLDDFLRKASRTSWGRASGMPLPPHAPTTEEISHEVRWRELDVDPAVWWRSVHVPVFAAWGGADDHPVAQSAAAVRAALAAAGNRDATLLVYPQADHELMEKESGAAWPRLAPGFIDAMIAWTRKQAGLPPAP
jgi:pimeloyl-ACP methyl ester carboxylesterase